MATWTEVQRTGRASHPTVALAVEKRGRQCVVGKLVEADGEVALAVVHRHQHGVTSTISLPVVVVRYAEGAGARWLYFRRDTTGQMWRLPLADLWRLGHYGPGAGAELYIPIARMAPVPWREWAFAHEVVRLEANPAPAGVQRRLFD